MFLRLMCKYVDQKTQVKVKNVADNKTLIDRCVEHTNFRELFPNAVMDSERDATEEAYQEVTCPPMTATFEWVR